MSALLRKICSELVWKAESPTAPSAAKLHAAKEGESPKEFKAAAGDLPTLCYATQAVKAWSTHKGTESVV